MRALREVESPPAGVDTALGGGRPEVTATDEPDVEVQASAERGFFSYLVSAAVGAVLVVILAIAVAAIGLPALTGSKALTVLTSSMEPSLPPGTMVVVRATDPAEIKAGQVMTYQLNSGDPTVITHRVTQVLIEGDGKRAFILKGDNNPKSDPSPVHDVQVVGTLWYAIPYVGWVSQAIAGEGRMWLVAGLVTALFAYAAWMVVSSIRDKARKRREAEN